MVAIAVAYFSLLGQSGFQEPGDQIRYDVSNFRDLDHIETRFVETGIIEPGIDKPKAMCVGEDGKIYVAGENELVVYGSEDKELARFEIKASPICMTVAEDGTLFVGYNDHIELLDASGTVQAVWERVGEQPYLTSIAVSGEEVYVADAGNKVVLQYNRDGQLQSRIGKKDLKNDIPGIEVPSPYLDLAINPDGDLWVVNPGLLGMERYRNDSSLVTSWYRASFQLDGFSGCCNPTHIAFMNDGKLITAEKGLVRIKIYDVTSGEYQELVAGSREFPREQSLKDIAVDKKNRILALDPRNNAVRVFELKEAGDEKRT